jgi:pSer/pThr/pTyr-binding forkhead associated (FHA) protein
MEIIIGRKGTQRTPITDMTVSRAHCKLTVEADGTMWLENLSANGTYVDGVSILKKRVSDDTVAQLGGSFKIAMKDFRLSHKLRPTGKSLRETRKTTP